MSRKDVKETLRLTFPRIAPYKKVEDYLTSKARLSTAQLPSFQCDKARNDPELQLTAAVRTYNKTIQALKERRELHKFQRDDLDSQWKELEVLEDNLKNTFIKLSNFIKSNEDKRNRAIARKQEDFKLVAQREKEIEDLQNKMADLEKVKNDLDKEIIEHAMYLKYLNFVVTVAPLDFKNAEDSIQRYESLVQTKKELGERQGRTFEELEHARYKINKLSDENAFRLLGMNNTVASMHSRYQTAWANAMHWERIVWSIKNYAFRKYKEITEVKQACSNLYFLMCRRKNETPKIAENDFEKQLVYIKKTLRELSNVRLEAEAATRKTFSSVKAETSKTS